jgi:hypothetical protein
MRRLALVLLAGLLAAAPAADIVDKKQSVDDRIHPADAGRGRQQRESALARRSTPSPGRSGDQREVDVSEARAARARADAP